MELSAIERRCLEVNRMPASVERDRAARELGIDLQAAYANRRAEVRRITRRVLLLIVAAVVWSFYSVV